MDYNAADEADLPQRTDKLIRCLDTPNNELLDVVISGL